MSNNNGSKKMQFAGKTVLMKELQRTISFRAYDTISASGNSKGIKDLMNKAHELYFGKSNDEDSVGYAEQLMKGMNAFAPLFEKEEDLGKGNTTLIMKSIFHCTQEKIVVSTHPKDKGINMAVLSSKGINNRVQLTARGVWDFGKQVEKFGKRALALVQASEYANGNLPSGKTYEDYLLFLRESMYNDLNANVDKEKDDVDKEKDDDCSSSTKSVEGSEVDADCVVNNMKDNWFFPGYIAFALWGPMMPEDMDECHKAQAFFESDNGKKVKSSGRLAIRKEEENEQSVARTHASVSEGRGLSNKDFLFFASIAQQSSSTAMVQSNRNIDRQLKHYQDKVKRSEREVERWRTFLTPDIMMDHSHLVYVQFKEANDKFHACEAELDAFMKNLTENVNGITSNQYQVIVDKCLSSFKQPDEFAYNTPNEKKRKRSETPMSNIDIIVNQENNTVDGNGSERED